MEQKIVVITVLEVSKDKSYTVKSVKDIITGICDPKMYAFYIKLKNMNYCVINSEFKKWKGERFGSRLEYDETDKIGDSYAEILHFTCADDAVYVYEMYNSKKLI